MKTKATYTRIKNSKKYNDNSMSLGFRRLHCLPQKIRTNIQKAFLIENKGEVSEFLGFATKFFNQMTEKEYCIYLMAH